MAEDAAAAAGRMLDDGAMVWVPHEQHVWKKAVVVRRLDDGARALVRLQAQDDGEYDADDGVEKVVTVSAIARLAGEVADDAMPICNVFEAEGACDMCTLNHLHEPAVLKNLELRFAKKLPYTYTGAICIAVNPYQWLDLYGRELYEQYLERPRDSLPPHPFALSATAYMDMKRTQVDQSILVSGESGAGKTETVKIMMNYLASISGGGHHGTTVIDQVLQSNPLLESFGNAKTKRNDNSSRFGKFAQLQFDTMGSLVGCLCETYLLEKSRVVGQTEGERNYHVFYQIFRLSDERKKELRLHGDVTSYKYVAEGAKAQLTGIDDVQCLKETQDALDTIGISTEEQNAIFEIVAAILNLGEVEFAPNANDSEKSHVSNEDIVDNIGALLCTKSAALHSTLLERSITAGSESYTIPLNAEQASDLRDALAKGMYTQLFDWLVHRINKAICSTNNVKTHIGLLDIFGFESFDQNGFEQLCINYANEKLQQKFNSDVFKDVQQEYVDEGIPLTLVTFEDNQPILDLIEGRMGIVSMLNEEVLRPQATDSTFVSKVLDACSDHPSIEKNRINPLEFTIHHYAGDVTYNGAGFLEKNKDTLPTDMVQLLSGSHNEVISGIFTPTQASKRSSRGKNGKEGRQKGFLVGNTIAGAFRKQLSELMLTINKTSSQYVRCIKPNANKSAVEFNRVMIVEQLRCAGVIAAIRISRAAFPNRLPLVEFQQRFQIICPSAMRDAEPCDMVAGLLKELVPDIATSMQNTKFAVGSTKVYFSSGLLQRLEDRRNVILKDHAILVQKVMHGYVYRKRFLRQRNAAVEIQSRTRGSFQARRYRTLRTGMIKLQSLERGRKQRYLFGLLLNRVRKERELDRERLRKIAQQEVAERILQKEIEERILQKEMEERDHNDPQPEPVEDDWSDESDKEDEEGVEEIMAGPVSPRTLRALTEAASKVAEAESAARDAKSAAEAALELNRELVAQNDRLRSTLSSNVAEYADAELLRENERLKQQVLQLQTKLVRSQEVSLISAKVVDSRITYREGRQFVEYKLQIETNTRGTLYVWHRYSTFRNLAATLQTKNGYKRKEIPELPNKQLFGNFSEKIIQDRVAKLNQFLEAATNAEYLQWGIRVDQDTCVYKRRVKSASRESISTASMQSSSPRSSSRLSMKSFSFRRGSTAGN
uniref:Unconventional myosin-Vc n=1 Tax=Peronospora matthiolae TaxID=2874970 RepID=A0AAV1TMU3_9STRA